MDLDPALILSMWTAGTAAVSSVVVTWRVVGSGYVRLSAAVVVLFGAASAAAGSGALAWLGTLAALIGLVAAGSHRIAVGALGLSGLFLILATAGESPMGLAVTGAMFLGAITTEMMLGHWYLVDPTLPRWALHTLAIGAGIGLVADFVYLTVEGAFSWGSGDEVVGWAFVAMAAFSALLIAGVSMALREPSYTGVMAATGLGYLAVLTSFGVVVVGRLLAF